MTTITAIFDGYWREVHAGGIPPESGVYCVYDATFDASAQTVSLRKLIYVGESANVQRRIRAHEKKPLWKRELGPQGVLCYSFAPLSRPERERGEAAIIFQHKPPTNEEYVHSFPFPETTMALHGKTALLRAYFTVRRSTGLAAG